MLDSFSYKSEGVDIFDFDFIRGKRGLSFRAERNIGFQTHGPLFHVSRGNLQIAQDLLEFLAEPEHAAHGALTKDAHIVITDASMLEDTATKAYGWRASMDDLRAAAQGEALFTKVMDVLQLWVERVRQFQDLRYIVPNDLGSPEAKGLREQVGVL